ncbi:MAG TPA: ABC transporter ATP-binding protein [Chloroflexota bacterium]|nr:ABC transporter ATP-binding protein [Chloroflexota bacterium]
MIEALGRNEGSLTDEVANEGTDPENPDVILQLTDVVRSYRMGGEDVHALAGVSLTVLRGEFMSIMGRSGSGKSTLLNVIGCLDRPTSGTILLDGVDVTKVPKGMLPRIRREKIGFVFQQFNLIPTLTALENVMLPMEYAGLPEKERRHSALEMLEAVGLADRLGHRPNELSGGQQQRVSIARALAPHPAIVLADEPTGALDTHIAHAILDLMRRFNAERRQTFIIVTHDPLVAEQTDRVVRLSDGLVVSDEVETERRW